MTIPNPLNLGTARQLFANTTTPTTGLDALPRELALIVKQFYGHLATAQTTFEKLIPETNRVWMDGNYSAEYKQKQVTDLGNRIFAEIKQSEASAGIKLKEAQELVKAKTTPPTLDADASVHEMKLMNAREEVKLALEGVGSNDQAKTLVKLFNDTLNTERPIAHYIGGTDAYQRLLKDGIARLDFESEQPALRRQLLSPDAVPYVDAQPVLTAMAKALSTMEMARVYTAMDNPVLGVQAN